MTYYNVIIPKDGNAYITHCDEYIKIDKHGIEFGCGEYGVSSKDTRAVAYCTLKEYENNIPHSVAFYEICEIEPETFLGMDIEKAEYILKQLLS